MHKIKCVRILHNTFYMPGDYSSYYNSAVNYMEIKNTESALYFGIKTVSTVLSELYKHNTYLTQHKIRNVLRYMWIRNNEPFTSRSFSNAK